MQVRLLGPVDVIVDGGPRPVRGVRRGAVLAVLALHCGKVVSTGQLVDIVWGETAPPTVVNTLQAHVSYLRRVLGSKAAIRARPPGYVLNLGTDGTDVQLAEQLLRRGSRSADPAQATRLLETALALWRGRPLVDLVGLPWLEAQAERLELLGVRAKLALSEARLAAGEHLALVRDLEQLAAERPLDEQVHAQLMLALYRSGRQADALASYHRLRLTLDEELGIDPGQELRDLEAAVLRQDPALDAPRPAAAPPLPSSRVPIPAQLPSALSAFVGRGAELASLSTLLPAADEAGSAAVAIAALSGTAGVGKPNPEANTRYRYRSVTVSRPVLRGKHQRIDRAQRTRLSERSSGACSCYGCAACRASRCTRTTPYSPSFPKRLSGQNLSHLHRTGRAGQRGHI